jgi:hypothetical protein
VIEHVQTSRTAIEHFQTSRTAIEHFQTSRTATQQQQQQQQQQQHISVSGASLVCECPLCVLVEVLVCWLVSAQRVHPTIQQASGRGKSVVL